MDKNLKVGDTFKEVLPNGYTAEFEVLKVNDDKSYLTKRVALYKADTQPKTVEIEKVVEEVTAETKIYKPATKATAKKPTKRK